MWIFKFCCLWANTNCQVWAEVELINLQIFLSGSTTPSVAGLKHICLGQNQLLIMTPPPNSVHEKHFWNIGHFHENHVCRSIYWHWKLKPILIILDQQWIVLNDQWLMSFHENCPNIYMLFCINWSTVIPNVPQFCSKIRFQVET